MKLPGASLAVLPIFMAVLSSQAYSAVTFCNRSDRPIFMALATMNQQRPDWGKTSQGWWYAQSGECKVVYPRSINAWEWYGYYAVSEDNRKVWPAPPQGDMASNMVQLCATDNHFDMVNTKGYADCVSPSYPVFFKWFLMGRTLTNYTFSFTD